MKVLVVNLYTLIVYQKNKTLYLSQELSFCNVSYSVFVVGGGGFM